MKKLFLNALFILLSPLFVLSQQPSTQSTATQNKNKAQAIAQLPPAAPFLSDKICGKGVFLISLGGQSLGRETFEITCRPDGGFEARGQTNMKLPSGAFTQDTMIEIDKQAVPLRFTAKGEAAATPVDLSIVFKDNKATMNANGATNEIPYTNRAAVTSSGVNYLLQFVGARYDTARGGPQEILLFPETKSVMERAGRDEVRALGTAVGQLTAFDRYTLQIGAGGSTLVLWTDMQGRIAVVSLPAQNFVAAREEYASMVEPLRAALVAKVKDLVPDYSAPPAAAFTAEEVKITAKGFTLAGTLLLPKAGKRPFAAVVMSTGSGQQTRDATIPSLEKYRPFRQIAEFLASRGIAVLRADDRGVGDSSGFNTLDAATTFDFADDVRAQVSYLRTRKEIDPRRIVVIGHSEGGLIAPLVAASDPRLAGIVIMAGTAKRGEDVLRFQLNYASENDSKLSTTELAKRRAETESFLRAIRENGDVSKYPPVLRGLSSPWGRAFLDYDPQPTMRRVRQPVLILQGALDRQVTAEQARMLEQAAREGGNRDVTVRVFPKLNHLFLTAKTGAQREYAALDSYSLSEDVLIAIADWLQVKLKVGK